MAAVACGHGPVNQGASSLSSSADGEVPTAPAVQSDTDTVVSDKGSKSFWDPVSWQFKNPAAGGGRGAGMLEVLAQAPAPGRACLGGFVLLQEAWLATL